MQWILKLLAMLCVFGGSVGMGGYLSYEYKKIIKELECVSNMLYMLIQEIEYNKMPFPEACSQVARHMQSPYDNFLEELQKGIRGRTGENIQTLWKKQVELLQRNIILPRNCVGYLIGIVDGLGFMDSKIQLQKISFQREQIEREIQRRREQQGNKCRIYLSLGTMSGILCIIIFL